MIDIITTLKNKHSRLLKQKENFLKEYNEVLDAIDKEIQEVDQALSIINKVTKDCLCDRCNGTGYIRYCDAAGDMDDKECPCCHGTGVKGVL